MEKVDLYKALEVSKEASQDEIRRSYRKLARKYHPDANPGDKQAEERFKEIQHAYEVLYSQAQQEQEAATAEATDTDDLVEDAEVVDEDEDREERK